MIRNRLILAVNSILKSCKFYLNVVLALFEANIFVNYVFYVDKKYELNYTNYYLNLLSCFEYYVILEINIIIFRYLVQEEK